MKKYKVDKQNLRKLLDDRIEDCKKSNSQILETPHAYLDYLINNLNIDCYFSTISSKYIDKAYKDACLVLNSLGIEEFENAYYMTLDAYDNFLVEVRLRAIYQQLYDKDDIVFYLTDKNQLHIMKKKQSPLV